MTAALAEAAALVLVASAVAALLLAHPYPPRKDNDR